MSRIISLSSSLFVIVLTINLPLIASQNNDKKNDDDNNFLDNYKTPLIWTLSFLLLSFLIGCFFSIRKKRRQLKDEINRNFIISNKSQQPSTITIIASNNNLLNNNNNKNKSDELDLENNWITDVYSNNNNLRKDIFSFKKKFYNLENDSLQSVQLCSEEKENDFNDSKKDKKDKKIDVDSLITPPPYAYHPSSSTPNLVLPLNDSIDTTPKKDLSEKALEFLIKNPPKNILPIQAEIHSILKVQENVYLNPYSSWKFIIENNVVEESGVAQITNYGKSVEINTRKWSSVTNDVCVHSNYPFFVQNSSSVRRNSISAPPNRLNNIKNSSNQIKRNSSNAITIKSPALRESLREEVIHYFEVTVISKAEDVDTIISIGLSTKPYPYFRLLGWNKYSVGYQSNNGQLYHNDINSGKDYGPAYTVGDTIGCGYKPATNEIFFTKNGEYLGPYITYRNPFVDDDNSLKHIWYPSVSANGQCKLEINFGGEILEDAKDLFKYKLARNFGPGSPLSVVKQLRGGELMGGYETCKSENVELERVERLNN